MKKYRLKKWYPSLPNSWNVGTEVELTENKLLYSGKHATVWKREVENNPEFWEPVEEKTYEILSFRCLTSSHRGTDIVVYNSKTGCYDWDDKESKGWSSSREDNFINDDYWAIHSVRRLSDGEVFTVGDKVELKRESPYCGCGVKYEIEGFKNECCDCVDIKLKDKGTMPLIGAKLIKQPLFTTEDGVDIYEGDKVWFVDNNYRIHTCIKNTKQRFDSKYFSTEEKVQEYIDNNKPRYSRKDIEEAMDKIGFYDMSKQTYNKSLWFHLDK